MIVTEATLNFSDLRNKLTAEQLDFVDARAWKNYWKSQWVVYADMIAFATKCLVSQQTTVNSIVRFHRAVEGAKKNSYSSDIRSFQFTDAVFILTSQSIDALKFASTLQHQCLAYNANVMASKKSPMMEHLIVPRITIAFGSVLSLPEQLPPSQQYIGVNTETLLAGSGIVTAYLTERKSSGYLISIDQKSYQNICNEDLEVRGPSGSNLNLIKRWLDGTEPYPIVRDEVVDFPWVTLRPDQDRIYLRSDEKESSADKLQTILNSLHLQMGEFVARGTPLETFKHYGGVYRHVVQVVQILRNCRRPKRWAITDLERGIAALTE